MFVRWARRPLLDYSCPTCDFEGRDLEVFSCCHAAGIPTLMTFLPHVVWALRLEVFRLIPCGNSSSFFSVSLRFSSLLSYTTHLTLISGWTHGDEPPFVFSGSWHLPVSFLTDVITSSHFIVALLKVRISSSLFVSADLLRNFCARHYAGVGMQPCSGWEPPNSKEKDEREFCVFQVLGEGSKQKGGKTCFSLDGQRRLAALRRWHWCPNKTVKMSWVLIEGTRKIVIFSRYLSNS